MPWLLDINDCDLSLFEGLRTHYQEPAVCVWQDKSWLFGRAAWQQSRLQPQQANNLYLSRLSTEPLPRAIGNAALHADLVYQQLLHIHSAAQPEQLSVAVPGNLSSEQLAVLLGIAKEAQLPISQFYDSAVLALVQAPLSAQQTWVLDVALHHLILSNVNFKPGDGGRGQLQRQQVELINGAGLANLVDGWVNVAADEFVKATRFDPLHTAATEQQLQDQVRSWLDNSHTASGQQPPELAISIELDGNQRRIDLNTRLFAEKTQQRAESLTTRLPADAQVAVTTRAAAIPGLLELLGNHKVQILSPAAVVEGYLALLAAGALPPNDGVVFLTGAAHLGSSAAPTSTDVGSPPTHGLRRDRATPLVQLLSRVNYNQRGQWLHLPVDADALVNGQPPNADSALTCGDTLSVGARQYQLIQVLGDPSEAAG